MALARALASAPDMHLATSADARAGAGHAPAWHLIKPCAFCYSALGCYWLVAAAFGPLIAYCISPKPTCCAKTLQRLHLCRIALTKRPCRSITQRSDAIFLVAAHARKQRFVAIFSSQKCTGSKLERWCVVKSCLISIIQLYLNYGKNN